MFSNFQAKELQDIERTEFVQINQQFDLALWSFDLYINRGNLFARDVNFTKFQNIAAKWLNDIKQTALERIPAV